jgi:hypothetical protein
LLLHRCVTPINERPALAELRVKLNAPGSLQALKVSAQLSEIAFSFLKPGRAFARLGALRNKFEFSQI